MEIYPDRSRPRSSGRWDADKLDDVKAFLRELALTQTYQRAIEPPPDPAGYASLATSLATELQQHVRKRLSAHAYPREIEFVAELPKTPSGKIQRFLLRNQEIARQQAAMPQAAAN